MSDVLTQGSFAGRFADYCRERFPPIQHGAVIAAFVYATAACAAALQRDPSFFSPRALAAGLLVAFVAFLQLRIADEFKDAEDDARFRPERPVPRGLVSLKELGAVAAAGAFAQVVAAGLAGAIAVAWLAATFVWMALMGREFLVPRWLRAHPLAYVASHTVVIPLIAVTVAACSGAAPDAGRLAPFLLLAYASSTVFEFGRKIRSPGDERRGVETYTALWGPRGALAAWGIALLASGGLAIVVAARVGGAVAASLASLAVAVALAVAAVIARRFLVDPAPGRGSRFAAFSGAWLVALYVLLGLLGQAFGA